MKYSSQTDILNSSGVSENVEAMSVEADNLDSSGMLESAEIMSDEADNLDSPGMLESAGTVSVENEHWIGCDDTHLSEFTNGMYSRMQIDIRIDRF